MNICIVSGESRAGTGGLAAYNRLLTKHLRLIGCQVTSVARFERALPGALDYAAGTPGWGSEIDGLATRLIGAAGWASPLLPRLRHLTGRGALRGLAAGIFSAAYGRSLSDAIPLDTDVVHYIGTGWELLGFAAMKQARGHGASFTILPAVHPGTWGDGPLDIDLYKQADAVFCLSDDEVEHLAAMGVDRHRLVRTWLAPASEPTGDGSAFRRQHRLGDRPIILFIARKVRSKGFHTLCEAMPAVLAVVPDACLVCIGPDGEPPYPPVPAGSYLDLGHATDAAKADALAACDVFCMPSVADSFGIVYIEAWSYGKPVIGGPAPAVRELLAGGEAGLAVDQTPEAVADMLIQLLRDTTLRNRMGYAGVELLKTRYNWQAATQMHLDVFKQASAIRQPRTRTFRAGRVRD